MKCNASALLDLATSAGYLELSVKQQMAVETYLDCQVASSGGGGGSGTIYVADYGGITPTPTPAGTAFAYDTSNGSLWSYDGSHWYNIIA